MAMQLETELYGMKIYSYIKIGGSNIVETGKDENGKLYSVIITLDYYTNKTKEFNYKQETEELKNLRYEELSIEFQYKILMSLEKFQLAEFI